MQSEAPPRRLDIRVDRELTHPQVLDLLREHLAGMHAESPPESVHALDLDGLRRPEITFLTAWRLPPDARPGEEGELIAMGALKELTPTTASEGGHGELKSMRTRARHLRQGAAQAILTELLKLARERGYARVSLETGTTPGFDAAVAMYRRFGFVDCGPFADYREDVFSRFMSISDSLSARALSAKQSTSTWATTPDLIYPGQRPAKSGTPSNATSSENHH